MKRTDVIGNNISNINTNGYKYDRAVSASFEDMLIQRMNDPESNGIPVIGAVNTGIYMDETITMHTQGALEQTGNSLDLAIRGSGYFTVQTVNGERYTRGGSFYIDNEGYMSFGRGCRAVGENGLVRPFTDNISVDAEGHIFADEVYLDTLRMVDFTDTSLLVKEGSLLYRNDGGEGNMEVFSGDVSQGYIEGSNVDIAGELTRLMESMQNYQSNQRIIQMLDHSLEKTVNEIGRV